MATDAWYKGQRLYDYTTASPTSLTDMERTKQYESFANVIWQTTSKAGFGHTQAGKWVVALYCQTKATPFDTIANSSNIGKQCTTNGINQCLNDELR
jgi:hypothetical protein